MDILKAIIGWGGIYVVLIYFIIQNYRASPGKFDKKAALSSLLIVLVFLLMFCIIYFMLK